jgi:hypothetical protein
MERHSRSKTNQIKELTAKLTLKEGELKEIEKRLAKASSRDALFFDLVGLRNNASASCYSITSQIENLKLGNGRLGFFDSIPDYKGD